MNLTVITAPPFEPVTLLQVYAHLRLDPDHEGSPGEETHVDDDMLSRMIATARAQVEQMTRRALVQQQIRLSVPAFPRAIDITCVSDKRPRILMQDRILLHRPPLIRVDSVRYYDGDNALQTVDPASYYATDEQVAELRFVSSFSAPTLYDRPDAVRVDYTAGYAPSGSPSSTQADYIGNVPQALKDAILLGVQLLYDQTTPADAEKIERMREALVQPYRVQLT